MDEITQTSLEALLLKATHSKNYNFDAAAVDAFCSLINNEKEGAYYGVKIISSRLPRGNENEMLQTLTVIDHCMSKCGTHFQNEVGKFRFLNELIKLVSPKYLGALTPLRVKQKILQLLYVWTLDYPKETKIIEAFDMLRKQGVVREIPNKNVASFDPANVPKKATSSVFQDEEKSKILQKLLQSKDPEDIQAANWLIKSMVKEDDKRAEMKSKRISELESVQNNVRLLNEMLNSYKSDISSAGELDLIQELYRNCERLRPSIKKLVLETHQEEGMLDSILKTNDELSAAFEKYNLLIVQGKQLPITKLETNESLLQFESVENSNQISQNGDDANSSVDVLCDMFTNATIPDSANVLQPVALAKSDNKSNGENSKEKIKLTGLDELDALGDHLIKENLQSSRQNFGRNNSDKVPMNILNKISEIKQQQQSSKTCAEPYNFDLDYLLNSHNEAKPTNSTSHDVSDDCLVDISDEKMLEVDKHTETEAIHTVSSITEEVLQNRVEKTSKPEIKLNDVFVKLESVKPSGVPPMTILDEKNGVIVTLHLAKGEPKEGVNVFVLTTVSKNEVPLSNYLFQAVIPKGCKLKLQPPSATDLPIYNPFLPPSAITQIMLIANPESLPLSLKFIISYVIEDETITEMGEVERLPKP